MRATTEAYREAALEVLLKEVNRTARDLELPEKLPIKRSDLLEIQIATPFWADSSGSFGNVSTSNYYYFASVGNKVGSVSTNLGADVLMGETALYESLKRRYLWPKSKMDTNAAYATAIQWLSKAGMDVQALERDAEQISIGAWELGSRFVPVYHVDWNQLEAHRSDLSPPELTPLASVKFVAPERRLLTMEVNYTKYIKHKALAVPDRDRLLQQTDDPKLRELWRTSEAYKAEALKLMLQEVNWAARALNLPERLPVEASDRIDVVMGTPYTADHQGLFATVYTEKYAYRAGKKIAYVGRSHRYGREQHYIATIRTRYVMPKSRMDPDAAYNLATQWLAAVSIDLKRLEADYPHEVSPLWMLGDKFVPYYIVEWVKPFPNSRMRDVAAVVEVLEPERSLEGLLIEKQEYMTRGPIVVPNREKLLEK